MIRTSAAFVALVVAAVWTPAQEVVVGAEVFFETSLGIETTEPASAEPAVSLGISPQLAVFAGSSELRASGDLALDYPDPGSPGRFSLRTLSLELFPADAVSLSMGLQARQPGAAILLSPVNYLAPLVLDRGSDGLPSTAGSSVIVGGTVFAGPVYFAAHVAPAPPPFDVAGLPAAFFSELPFLESTSDEDVGDLTRNEISIGATELAEGMARVSVSAEAGFTLGPVDVTALFYHGIDRIPTVSMTADVGAAPPGQFDLTAVAVESVISAAGVSAQAAAGPATFWFDGSFVPARRFGTTNLEPAEPGAFVSETIEAPHFELVAGAFVWLERIGLNLLAEYHHAFVGTARTDIVRLDFPGTALISISGDLADGLVGVSASGAAIIPDRSAILLGSVTVSPASELSLFFRVPFVVAGQASFLSAFSTRFSVTAGLVYRF